MRMRTRENMKMLIFLSPENPLWGELLSGKPSIGEIRRLSDVIPQNLSNWQKGITPTPRNAANVFDAVLASVQRHTDESRRSFLSDLVKSYRKRYASDDCKLYDAAIALRIPVPVVQRLVDMYIYASYPLFPELYFERSSDAQAVFDALGGVYEVWAWHREELLRCALRVRYVLEVANGSVIRCKLNLPANGTTRTMGHEFDGFVCLRKREGREHHFWVFEGRKQHPRHQVDYRFCITTGLRDFEGVPTLSGTFLGPSYSDDGGPADLGDVLIRRATVPYEDDFEEVREFMGNVRVVQTIAECKRVTALAKRARALAK